MEQYQALADAIILQAVRDYRRMENPDDIRSLEKFFFSQWFGCLTNINPEMLVERLREERKGKAAAV